MSKKKAVDTELAQDPEVETKKAPKSKAGKKKKETDKQAEIVASLEATIKTLTEAEEGYKAQANEGTDRALRAQAELENFKKRKQQEVDSFRKYAAESVISAFLPVLDSFDMACEHAKETKSEEAKEIINGFTLIQKQFHGALDKIGVTPINALNEAFDPQIHQAVAQEEVEGVKPEVVIKEMQKGYKLHDRILRPSMVVVSQ